jgi:uncharacterized membrane protein
MMFAKLYAVTLPVFFLIDMVWLGLIAKGFYGKYLGYIMKSSPNWQAAVAFYLLFIVGLVVFVVSPAVDRQQWQYALGMGALFGLITYATYDLTNLATVKDWPIIVTAVDMVWGTVLAASVSVVSYAIAARILL